MSAVPYPEKLYTPAENGWSIPDLNAVDTAAETHYKDQGYMMVDQLLSPQQVTDARDALDDLLTSQNPDVHMQFEADKDESLSNFIDLRKFMGFCEYNDCLRQLSEFSPLIETIEKILGGKSQMIQDMALLKPPGGIEKPWHQDQAYFNYSLDTKIVGVWIALDDATVENACMHILPRSHKEGPNIHFQKRDWQICDTEILGNSCTAAPLKSGGAILFDGLMKHGTPINKTTKPRRALQFHYILSSAEQVPPENRLQTFGSEGKDVSC